MEGDAHPETYERILEGALHALARRTPSGISMTDVANSADVSRGTVYRYFSDKESLLLALADYERRRYEASLRAALTGTAPGPERAVTLVEHTLAYFESHPSLGQLLDIEPEFVLENLQARLPAVQAAAEEFLGPMLTDLAVVRSGLVTTDQLSDLLVRLLLSIFLLPGPDAQGVTIALQDLVGVLITPTGASKTARRRRLG